MLSGHFMMVCLRHGLKMNDLIEYLKEPVNFYALSDEEGEKIIKWVAKQKQKHHAYAKN